jgi:hypothetical protein
MKHLVKFEMTIASCFSTTFLFISTNVPITVESVDKEAYLERKAYS